MAKKRKKKKSVQPEGGLIYIIKKVMTASVLGIAIFFILCASGAFIAYKKDIDPIYYPVFLFISSALSGFICGFTAILPIKKNGLIIGTASVIPAFFIIFAVITILNKTSLSTAGWASLGIMTFFGGIGGIAGNKK